MAGLGVIAQSAAVAMGNISPKTIIQIVAPTNQRLKVKEISLSIAGTSNTDAPVLVQVVVQSDAGTTSALTLVKKNSDDAETIQSTARHTSTVEPTTGSILMSEYVHPQTGFIWQAPFGGEIPVPGGTRLGLRVTTALTYNCVARMEFEE